MASKIQSVHRYGSLDYREASRIVAEIEKHLTAKRKAAAIAVTDRSGELIAFLRVGDPALSSSQIAMNKAWTAARERQPTAALGKAAKSAQSGFDYMTAHDRRYIGWGGGVPILYSGETVGAVGVSGLEEEEDVKLAARGASRVGLRNRKL